MCGIALAMFSFLFGYASFGYQEPDYEKIAGKITEKTAKKLKEQKNLCLVGTGGGMMNDIQAMHMSFYFYQEVDLKTARELLVYAISEYLSAINSNTEIRPYLHQYPFTAKNLEIRIWIYKPDRSELPPNEIDYIADINGILEYHVQGADPRQSIHEETYEEALELVNSGFTRKISQINDERRGEKIIINEVVAKDGAKVSINVESFNYFLFQIDGEGFKPYESLSFISNSCHEILYTSIQADKDGKILPIGISPAVIGESGGICHIDILREKDSIHLKFPWGIQKH